MAYGNSCYYRLSLSNVNIENATADSDRSTASNMSLILDDEISIQNHLYMKSLSAECCIENLSLSNLPNTFSSQETIELTLNMPLSVSDGNVIVGEAHTSARNTQKCVFPMHDVVTSSPLEALDHINKLLQSYVNKHLLFRYLECLCDRDLFADNLFRYATKNLKFSSDDLILISWYVEIATLMRLQAIAAVDAALGENRDISKPPKANPPKINKTKEKSITDTSLIFRNLEDVPHNVNRKLIDYTLFYDKDLSNYDGLIPLLSRHVSNYLTGLRFLETDPDGVVTEESRKILHTIRSNNIQLLQLTETCQELLKIEQNKVDSTTGDGLKLFFHNELLSLNLDEAQKCVFQTKCDLFLPIHGSTVWIMFGPMTSRVLGINSTEKEKLCVGPLMNTNDLHPDKRLKLKKNNVTNEYDRLFCRVRPMARSIHVLSDIIENDCSHVSMWTKMSAFPSFKVIASYKMSKTDKEMGAIQKLSVERSFMRMKQSQNILRNINIVLVDDNFHELDFMRQTYCYFTLCIRPASLNI